MQITITNFTVEAIAGYICGTCNGQATRSWRVKRGIVDSDGVELYSRHYGCAKHNPDVDSALAENLGPVWLPSYMADSECAGNNFERLRWHDANDTGRDFFGRREWIRHR